MLNLRIEIPLIPVFKHDEHLLGYINDTISELCNLSQTIIFNIDYIGKVSPKIYLASSKKIQYITANILVWDIDFYLSEEIISNLDMNDLSEEQLIDYFGSLIANELELKIFNFLVLTQIAKPGTLKSLEGYIYFQNRLIKSFYPFVSIHRESLSDILTMKWPVYKSLSILNVWEWYNKNNFTFNRHSKTKLEMAINAFSHIFSSNLSNLEMHLLWSLMGIEGLYCTSKEGIAEQIFNKTQVVLGPLVDFKSRLKQMYNFRSRFIHGDMNIPPNNYFYDDDEHDKFSDDLYSSTILSVAILTCTIQEMILRDINELKFIYNLTD